MWYFKRTQKHTYYIVRTYIRTKINVLYLPHDIAGGGGWSERFLLQKLDFHSLYTSMSTARYSLPLWSQWMANHNRTARNKPLVKDSPFILVIRGVLFKSTVSVVLFAVTTLSVNIIIVSRDTLNPCRVYKKHLLNVLKSQGAKTFNTAVRTNL